MKKETLSENTRIVRKIDKVMKAFFLSTFIFLSVFIINILLQ